MALIPEQQVRPLSRRERPNGRCHSQQLACLYPCTDHLSAGDENSPSAPCVNVRPVATQDTLAATRDGALFGSHVQSLEHLGSQQRRTDNDHQLIHARQELYEVRRNRDAQYQRLHEVSNRLADARLRRERLEQQRNRIHSRFQALELVRRQGHGGDQLHLPQGQPLPRDPAPQQMLMDVADRGRAALESAEHLVQRMIPLLPQSLRDLLQGRIRRVQQAAAALENGLNQPAEPDDTQSNDTQVWHWPVEFDRDEVTSLARPGPRQPPWL